MTTARSLRVATRGSRLALYQTSKVVELIERLPGPWKCETVVVHTVGDRLADAPIEKIGGQGAFVKEVSAPNCAAGEYGSDCTGSLNVLPSNVDRSLK